MRQREKDRIRNRALFLESAERLFEEKGYSCSTIEDIAERAGFSKATIYNYFGGKDHLLAELIQEKFRGLIEMVTEVLVNENNPREAIDRYTALSIECMQQNIKLFRVMIAEGFKNPEIVEDIIHPNIFIGLKSLNEMLSAFFTRNASYLNPKLDPEELAFQFMSMLAGYAGPMGWICKNKDLSTKKDELLELFFNGALKKDLTLQYVV